MQVQHFFEARSSTLSYVVHDGGVGIVIDPVRDYDPRTGRTSWASAGEIAAYVEREGLAIAYAIDTHVHADHMTGLPYFAERFGARTVTGVPGSMVMVTAVVSAASSRLRSTVIVGE